MQHRDMDERDRDYYPVPPEPHRRSSSFNRSHLPRPPNDSSPRTAFFSASPNMRDVREMPSPGSAIPNTDPAKYGQFGHSPAPPVDHRPPSVSRPSWNGSPVYPTQTQSPYHQSHQRFTNGDITLPPLRHDSVSSPPPSSSGRPPMDPRTSFPFAHRPEHSSHSSFRSQDGLDGPEASSSRSPPRWAGLQHSVHDPPPTLNRAGSSGNSVPSVYVTTPISSNSSTSAKHPAPADKSSTEPKKKKRRQAYSCAECSKRKQKCNRETPCQHCVSRKVPHLCITSVRNGSPPPRPKPKAEPSDVSTKESSRSTQSVTDERNGPSGTVALSSASQAEQASRIRDLESIVNAMVNCVGGLEGRSALQRWRRTHPPATSPPPLAASLPSLVPKTEPGVLVDADEIPSGGNQDAYIRDVDQQAGARNPQPQFGGRKVDLKLNDHGSFREQLAQITEEGEYATLQKFIQNLPEREYADRLVDFFFKKINYVRYPIDERLFRKAFEAVYSAAGQVTEESVRALPLISAVLATACRLAPAEDVHPKEMERQSVRLYWDAQFSLTISTQLNPMNIRLVETRIVLGLYLIIVQGRRLAEGWSMFQAAVAAGQIVGLHRDGTKVAAELDPYMIEYRRRLWSYLCHADATFSCLLNRPPSIDPMFSDTKPPSNIDLKALVGAGSLVEGKPMSETTDATYLILRKRLAVIVTQIVRNFQRVDRDPTYDEVLALDAQLTQLRNDLPPQFRMNDTDKSKDKDIWYLPIHRYYIQTEILHFTIILHRPWFLRDLKSDRYEHSRRACAEATRTDFWKRSHFRDDVPDFFETLRGGSLRQFMPAMVAGISLLLEPEGEYADIHRQIVDRFLGDHDKHLPDGYSREEVEIVANLKRHDKGRAMYVAKSGRGSPVQDARPSLQDDAATVSTPLVYERSTSDLNGSASRGGDNVVIDESQTTAGSWEPQDWWNALVGVGHPSSLEWISGLQEVPGDSMLLGADTNQAPHGDWARTTSPLPMGGRWDQEQLGFQMPGPGSPTQLSRMADGLIHSLHASLVS